MKTYIYNTTIETARALIEHIIQMMNNEPEKKFHFAFSGGNTPSIMFDVWANEYKDTTSWDRLHVYWVDERCVPADDSESNFGTMRRLLLNQVPIPLENIFPIFGDSVPDAEAMRYSDLVRLSIPAWRGFPVFDAVLLGAGEDGHTSSIFPGQEYLLSSFYPYEVSTNPYNGQKRIAMTGCLIFNAKKVIFFVVGKNKLHVVEDILNSGDTGPAAYVAHHAWNVEVFIDETANPGKK